jgi:hypothetical protein
MNSSKGGVFLYDTTLSLKNPHFEGNDRRIEK